MNVGSFPKIGSFPKKGTSQKIYINTSVFRTQQSNQKEKKNAAKELRCYFSHLWQIGPCNVGKIVVLLSGERCDKSLVASVASVGTPRFVRLLLEACLKSSRNFWF